MSENKKSDGYIGYDYKEVNVVRERMSMCIDGYANFGWTPDDNMAQRGTSIKLKRDRKIINKAELTRLERNFEACMSEIETMERTKTGAATMYSLIIGVIGTAFIAGSVFAVTNEPPMILLTVLLGLPGIIGWVLAPLLYKVFVSRSVKKFTPLIEAKFDEAYEVCEKGSKLLNS
jgi:Flp pilus assembly protein TadB